MTFKDLQFSRIFPLALPFPVKGSFFIGEAQKKTGNFRFLME
jgi:hypothetical protein